MIKSWKEGKGPEKEEGRAAASRRGLSWKPGTCTDVDIDAWTYTH